MKPAARKGTMVTGLARQARVGVLGQRGAAGAHWAGAGLRAVLSCQLSGTLE